MIEAPPFRDGRLHIGLTGGIASGKSTVARLFVERGVPVIDLDQVAREVVEPGQPALGVIAGEFGADLLNEEGRLDRRALRARVFRDEHARRRLEALLHPLILKAAVRHATQARGAYLIVVAPLLVEFGLANWVDRVLVVDCDPETQLKRLLARDGGDEDLARSILAAQASREQRLAQADDVIANTGAVDDLSAAVASLDAAYREMAASGTTETPGMNVP